MDRVVHPAVEGIPKEHTVEWEDLSVPYKQISNLFQCTKKKKNPENIKNRSLNIGNSSSDAVP